MSLASRAATVKKSARLARIESMESNREVSSFLKRGNWRPRISRRSNCEELDVFMRGQYFAYVIMGGNPGLFSLREGEFQKQIKLAAELTEELWGEGAPINNQELFGRVIRVTEWEPTNESNLTSLVNFTNAIPNQIEDWEITSYWKEWEKTGKLNFRGEKELTTEMRPFLRNYSFDVTDVASKGVISKMNSSIPLMGIELEFTYMGRLDELLPVLSMGVFKSDSTTDVEFVSVPMECRDLIEELEKREKSFEKMLEENGLETNGMHVHVSKGSINLAQQARMYYLLNAEAYREFWSEIADRDVMGNRYCQFATLSRRLVEAVKSGDYSQLSGYDFPDFRETAINRTKRQTIEFRIFKSPDNLGKVIENIKIIQAILDYTAQGGHTLEGFKKFLLAE